MASDSGIKIRPLTVVLVGLAVLFVVAGFVYFTSEAKNLPAFFPGHSAHETRKHIKHGLLMIALAAASLVGAWFTTAPSKSD